MQALFIVDSYQFDFRRLWAIHVLFLIQQLLLAPLRGHLADNTLEVGATLFIYGR